MVFQYRTYSVLLVSASEKFNAATMDLLPMTDYWPVVTANSIAEARRKLLEQEFDIILINAPLPDDFGLRLAIDICSGSDSVVLILVKNELYNDIYSKGVGYGALTLSKPTSTQTVSQALRILCATRERLRRVKAKQSTVEEKIEEIRLVNRAKWKLIEKLNLSESEAHRYIEKQSMDMRITKREVAENILNT